MLPRRNDLELSRTVLFALGLISAATIERVFQLYGWYLPAGAYPAIHGAIALVVLLLRLKTTQPIREH